MTHRLVVLERHVTDEMPPRIIGVSDGETAEQMLAMAREHFAALGMSPGPLEAHPADDDLVAAVERAQPRPYYGAIAIGEDGVARRRRASTGRISIVEPERRRRRVRA